MQLAAGGADANGSAAAVVHHPALFVNARAPGGGGAGQAEGVVERVQMPGAAVQSAAAVNCGAQHGANLVAVDETNFAVAVFALQMLGVAAVRRQVAALERGVQHAGF